MELLAYMVVRPYFVHLLEGNPKLAGQRDKQERTATQMCPRVVCFIHNLVQVSAAGATDAYQPLCLNDSNSSFGMWLVDRQTGASAAPGSSSSASMSKRILHACMHACLPTCMHEIRG